MAIKRFSLFAPGILFLLTILFTGCEQFPLKLPTSTPLEPTETISPSPLPTSTKIWFPVTDTPQPLPTRPTMTPTIDQRPLSGEVLTTDDFISNTRWSTSSTTFGSVAYGNGELTIALKEPRRSIYSFFLDPVPADYYLEMVINPSLCKGEDIYGIVFRSQSNDQFYRLVLRCDGPVRIDLVQGNSVVPIAQLESSNAFRPGLSQDLKVSLWLYGDGVRVYINDVYQLSGYRLRWRNGSIGVFARSAGESALTVNFSELTIRESDSFPPTPIPSETPLASPTHTPLKQP